MNSLEEYQDTIRENLLIGYKCPYEFTNQMLAKYSSAVKAMFNEGVPAIDPIRWFYLEWRCR